MVLVTGYIEDPIVEGLDKWLRNFDCKQYPDARGVQACRDIGTFYLIGRIIITIISGFFTYHVIQAKFQAKFRS